MEFDNRMAAAGYPVSTSAIAVAPFDVVSDFMRGMRGAMLDMYPCPDKLVAAQEKIPPILIGTAATMAQMGNNNRVFIPLHRGADGFIMSSSTVLDEAKPELLRAWVDATREYGRYG